MSDNINYQSKKESELNCETEVPGYHHNNEKVNYHSIKPYDPNIQRRVIRERLHSLEIINERFARQFRIVLFNLLRRSTDINVGNIKIQPYHEFASNLQEPTNLNLVHLNPLRGTALFVCSPELVFMLVDNLFGGDGRFSTQMEEREFTPTEQRIAKRLLTMALQAYDEAWSSIFSLKSEYVRSEVKVKFTNITSSPNDIVVTTPFYIEIGSHSGCFDICMPFSMIEPLRELLTNPPLEHSRLENMHWRSALAQQVKNTEVELVAKLTDKITSLSEILRIKKGDVICLDKPDVIEAVVDGIPVFSAQYGCIDNQYALRIENLIVSALLSLKKEHLGNE